MRQNTVVLVLGGGAIGTAIAIDLIHIKVPTAIVLGTTNIELRRNIAFSDTTELGKKMISNILATYISPEDLSIQSETSKEFQETWLDAINFHIDNRSITIWKKDEFPQYLNKLHPFVVFEEADVFVPNEQYGDILNPTAELVIDYVKKYQKFHVSCMFIFQDEKQFSRVCYDGWHQKIMGRVTSNNEDYKLTEDLIWKPPSYREFIMIDENGRFQRFEPIIACCDV